MSVTEILPLVESLPSDEKFQLLQFLVIQLGKDAGFMPFKLGTVYPVWTPYNVPEETVAKLAAMLAEEGITYGA